jgi:flagellar protein FlaI
VRGKKVRRNQTISGINDYNAEHDEINVEDVYVWSAERDEFDATPNPAILEEIKFDRGWTDAELNRELFVRRVMLAFLVRNGLNTYAEVAATIQAFINDPETVLALIANGHYVDTLPNLRKMESVSIDIDPEKEEMVPRPDPDEELLGYTAGIMERAEQDLFPEYRGDLDGDVAEVLADILPDGLVVRRGDSIRLDLDPEDRGVPDAWGDPAPDARAGGDD